MTRASFLVVAILAMTACASQPEPSAPKSASGGPQKTLQELNGSRIAMPVGLFLTGLDLDRDTRVGREEVRKGAAESFEASDANGDRYLGAIEFEDWSVKNLGTAHSLPGRMQFDHDQDASISLSEFTDTFDEIHRRLDADKDGALARAELLLEINGLGIDPAAVRAQIEAEVRQKMQGKMREMCQRGGRGL